MTETEGKWKFLESKAVIKLIDAITKIRNEKLRLMGSINALMGILLTCVLFALGKFLSNRSFLSYRGLQFKIEINTFIASLVIIVLYFLACIRLVRSTYVS